MDGELRGARGVALVVRFLLELALIAGAGAAGLLLFPDPWRWVASVLVPVAIAVVWGLLLAPRRRFDIGQVGRVFVETVLFVGTGVALAFAGLVATAIIGVLIWAIDRISLALLPQTPR
jgi:hypothetical protein